MRENIIVMVGGRSGVGKTSIIDFLVKNQGERYARPLSYTSRLKRNGEGCEEYNFISEEKMILMRDEGRFLNFDCVYGNYYAIAKKSIDVINTEGKVPIKEIHPSNQAKIKLCYPNAVSVLIKEIGVNGEEKRIGREKADTEYYENLNQGMQEKKSITLQCVDVDDLKKQAEMIRAEQIKLYESYADGILTRNEYLEKKKGLGEKLADLQEKIRIEEEEQETADELDEEIRSLTKQASQKTYIGGLTKECVDAFVSMVYLYDDQTMKVEFNCEDVIRRALEKYGA